MSEQQSDLSQNIIAQLGLESLPLDQRAELVDQMAQLVERRVMLRLLEQLGDADLETVTGMQDDQSALLAFLASKVPSMTDIIEQETEKVKSEMVLALAEDAELQEPATAPAAAVAPQVEGGDEPV